MFDCCSSGGQHRAMNPQRWDAEEMLNVWNWWSLRFCWSLYAVLGEKEQVSKKTQPIMMRVQGHPAAQTPPAMTGVPPKPLLIIQKIAFV